jgi:hypothetical protein
VLQVKSKDGTKCFHHAWSSHVVAAKLSAMVGVVNEVSWKRAGRERGGQ